MRTKNYGRLTASHLEHQDNSDASNMFTHKNQKQKALDAHMIQPPTWHKRTRQNKESFGRALCQGRLLVRPEAL